MLVEQRRRSGEASGAYLILGTGLCREHSASVSTCLPDEIRWPLAGGDSRKRERRAPMNTMRGEATDGPLAVRS